MTRLENLMGAQALALTDRLLAAGDGPEVGGSDSQRAALVTLLAHPGHPVSWLGDVLALTSSGVTRLVDRMEVAGLVTRTTGSDARRRSVELTGAGRRRAQAVLRARRSAMAGALAPLSRDDRTELERLLDLVVHGLAEDRMPAMRVCRMCDRTACSSAGRTCPLGHTTTPDDTLGQ